MTQRQFIKTTEPKKELWSWLDYATREANCKKILKKRIENSFFGIDINKIQDTKKQEELGTVRFIDDDDINEHAKSVALSVKQAKEYFYAADNSSELVSPVLYYYGGLSLGKALIDSTFKYNENTLNHGLSIDKGTYQSVTICKKGFFPRFHNCYSDDFFYLAEPKTSIKELLRANPELSADFNLTYNEVGFSENLDVELDLSTSVLPTKFSTSDIKLNAIDIHFLSTFILSSFCRYKPKEWSEFMANSEGFIVKKFLNNTSRRFPNLILNKLMGEIYLFYPIGRLA